MLNLLRKTYTIHDALDLVAFFYLIRNYGHHTNSTLRFTWSGCWNHDWTISTSEIIQESGSRSSK